MARVTLNHPRTYNVGAHRFIKGEPQIVDDDLGKHLKDSGHFSVVFANDIEQKNSATTAPIAAPTHPRQIVADIHLAISKLNKDDKAHFTATGQPQVKALTEMLGYPVTAKMRDEALAQELTMSDPVGVIKNEPPIDPNKRPKVETTETATDAKGITIKILKRRKPKAEGEPEAQAGDEDTDDLTDTGEGVEV